jgi:excisionase family DNA binding protein
MEEPTQPDDEVRCHRVREVAEFLTTSQEFVYQLIRTGELRATKLGNRTVIRHRDLLDYLDRQPQVEPVA